MPFDGNGTFNRTNNEIVSSTLWADLDDDAIKIRSDYHDTHDNDLAAGLNLLLLKDGMNSPKANLPMGSNTHTGVADALARDQYITEAQDQDGSPIFGGASTSGGTDIYDITVSPAISAYKPGQMFTFYAHAANTTIAVFVNINSLGDIKLHNMSGASTIPIGSISSGKMVMIVYEETSGGKFQIINPEGN